MTKRAAINRRLGMGSALAAMVALSACGGGGGSGGGLVSTPSPTSSPAPSPTAEPVAAPAPTPTQTPSYDTSEYRRSDGPSFHNAASAWTAGATGSGAKIAIVDTGIDMDNPEFAGRIDPQSADVAGNGTVEAIDGHGTQVALVAAAARNDTGVVGVAYGATVLALRTDSPGSCATSTASHASGDCAFSDRNIARAIDRAVTAGATVINLSLGGDAPNSQLLESIRAAAAAGIVIVVSAGNEGDGSVAGVDPNAPNPFAQAVRAAAGANAIIVGSVNEQGSFSSFSNKAGGEAQYFLSALGERVCCVYKDGALMQQTDANGTVVALVSGTSFSAPQVSGAVALLRQAFPNLSGAQMVDLLLRTARDAGATGTDPIYGRGILDIARAFAPQGATVLAGSTAFVRLGDDTGVSSAPMGDAVSGSLRTVVTDAYGRAFGVDLSAGMQRAAVQPRLLGAVDAGSRRIGGGSGPLALAFSIADGSRKGMAPIAPLRLSHEDADGARVLAARVAAKIAPDTAVGFAFRESAHGIVAQLQGHDSAAFLIAGEARGDTGFARQTDAAFAVRRQIGPWGLTASAERGDALLGALRIADGATERRRARMGTGSMGIAADRQFGPLDAALGLTWQDEDRTILGAYFSDMFGAGGARSLFVDAGAGWRFAGGWRLGGAVRQGWTRADRSALVGAGSNLTARAWSADLTKSGVFGRSDRVGLRIAQPLRVESGGLSLTLPVDYSYAASAPTFGRRTLSLAPHGREIEGELAWTGRLLGGNAAASVFYRTDPGHIAALPDDKGAAVRWAAPF